MHRIKKFLRIIFIVVFCFTLFISSIYVFIAIRGRVLIENNLKKFFKRDVDISGFKVSVPLNVSISDVKIKGLGKIDAIYISPSLINFLRLRVALNKVTVTRPNLIYTREKQEVPLLINSNSQNKEVKKKHQFPRITIPIFIKNININDGNLEILDKVVSENGLKLKINSLNLSFTNFSLPAKPIKTIYNLKGTIPWESSQQHGIIEGKGWVNFAKKDMEGDINLRDIDGMYLSPYYNNYVNLADLNVEKTSLDLLTSLNASNNNLLIRSHLELKNMVFKKPETSKASDKDTTSHKVMNTVFTVFSTVGGKIVLDFTIKTKFDRPRYGLENIKITIEDKLSKKVLD